MVYKKKKKKKKDRFNLFEERETGFQNRPCILSRKRIGQKRGAHTARSLSPEENHYLTLTRVQLIKAMRVTSESKKRIWKKEIERVFLGSDRAIYIFRVGVENARCVGENMK